MSRRPDKERQRRLWSWAALGYDLPLVQWWVYRPTQRALRQALLELNLQPQRILDVGCGTGEMALALRSAFPDAFVIGLDLAPGMLQQARCKGDWREKMAWVRGDAEHLPFAEASFDLVTCANSLIFYPDPVAALAEMRRVCRPGAWIGTVHMLNETVLDRCFRLGFESVLGPAHVPSRTQAAQWFTQAGLHVHSQGLIHSKASRIVSFGFALARVEQLANS